MENLKLWLSFWFKCVTTDFVNFKGRVTRRDFWVFMLTSCVLSYISCGAAAVWALVPLAAISTRRFNDTGRSPFHPLLLLVPGLGAWVWLYLVGVEEGVDGANEHGEKPTSNC